VALVALAWQLGSALPLLVMLIASIGGSIGWRMAVVRTVRQALALAADGAYDDAIAVVRDSWVMSGVEQQGMLAALELDAGEPEAAEARLRDIEALPTTVDRQAHHLSMIALAQRDQGRREVAITTAQRAYELHADQPGVVLRLAMLHAERGPLDDDLLARCREAVDDTHRSLARASVAPSLLPLEQSALAYVLAASSKEPTARELAARIELPDGRTDRAEVLYRLALCFEALGDLDATYAKLDQASELAVGATARRCDDLRERLRVRGPQAT